MKSPVTFTKTTLSAACASLMFACTPAPETSVESTTSNVQEEKPAQAQEQSYLTRDIQDEVFYFVMPDRFHNAIPENDNGDPNRPISFGGLDKSSKWAFHGGDIAGLEAKLDYIESLGVSAIWMTPILRNKAVQNDGFGHHGYWVVDFTEIDPHFGSNDELKSLIAAAHKREIKVFFDIITNHTADVIKYRECHDENGNFLKSEQTGCEFISSDALSEDNKYTPFVMDAEKNVKVPEWLNDPKYYNNQGDSFWQGESAVKGDFVGLDDIDTSQPEVISGLTEVFKDLISDFRPDGFRIDTVKHVDIEFWQFFGPAVMEHAQSIGLPEFFIFGEVYDGNPAGLSKFTTTGKLPSVLDFSFAFNARDVLFKNRSVHQLENLFDNDDYYRDHDSTPNDLLNFLGNHDMGRAGHFIEQDLPDINDAEKLRRSQLAHALMYFSRGVPVVYYGDEQGFTGDGGDVDSREDMDPSQVEVYNDNNLIGTDATTAQSNFNTEHPLFVAVSELGAIRAQHPALRAGEHINRIADEEKHVYGFSRIELDEDAGIGHDHLVVFNFGTNEQSVSLPTNGLDYQLVSSGELSGAMATQNGQLVMALPGLSYVMAKSTSPIAASTISDIAVGEAYQENQRTMLPITLAFDSEDKLNLAKLEIFDTSTDSDGSLIRFDTTAPFRAVLTPQEYETLSSIKVRATNYAGQTLEKSFALK